MAPRHPVNPPKAETVTVLGTSGLSGSYVEQQSIVLHREGLKANCVPCLFSLLLF
ncbi:hypothetical protein LguiA_006668 [Lonicera macranthoides]